MCVQSLQGNLSKYANFGYTQYFLVRNISFITYPSGIRAIISRAENTLKPNIKERHSQNSDF